MFENNIITQRFVKCINKLKDNNQVRSGRQFAMALDYLPQSLSEIVKGRRDVTIDLLRKAVDVYKINATYIFTGEGPMFMSEEDQKGYRVLTVMANERNEERIIHVPAPAQGSYPKELLNRDFIESLPSFTLPDYKFQAGTHRSFEVTGDSMEPTLFEGDKVVCSFIEPNLWESAVKDNYVYIIVSRGDVILRRVINKVKDKKGLVLMSDNNFYEPMLLPVGDIREVWYVRAKISPFLPAPQNLKISLHGEITKLQDTITQQSKMMQELMSRIK